MAKPLLIDIGHLSCGCTDHALESMHKAIATEPPVSTIWVPHQDIVIAGHIEDVTSRGLGILSSIEASLPLGRPMRKSQWVRMDDVAMELARRRFEGRDPDSLDVDDWLLWIDWVVSAHLSPETVLDEAEYLAARAVMAGRIQAAGERHLTPSEIAYLVSKSPTTIVRANAITKVPRIIANAAKFAVKRAAEFISDIGDKTRRYLKEMIIDHEERKALGEPLTHWHLQSRMQDTFAILNRDWRRVAVTEIGRDANEGYIAMLPAGAKVKRIEAYQDACPFCQRIHGMVFEVVDPGREDKDDWAHVWVGKSNVGRSASPRKRVGNELVERTASELWAPAAGLQHPHCRGRWLPVTEAPPDVAPEFANWLKTMLEERPPAA